VAENTPNGSEERIAAWQQAHGGVVVADQDVRVLLGVLAVLEGSALLGELDSDLAARLGARFSREGLPADAGLAAALNALNQRLRTNGAVASAEHRRWKWVWLRRLGGCVVLQPLVRMSTGRRSPGIGSRRR
jgi:hypothetical protein